MRHALTYFTVVFTQTLYRLSSISKQRFNARERRFHTEQTLIHQVHSTFVFNALTRRKRKMERISIIATQIVEKV